MCALLPSTSRAQAYVFKTDRAKIRTLLHAARYRTALELRQKCALPNGETNGQREDGPHFSSKSVTVAPLRCAGFSAFDCTPPQGGRHAFVFPKSSLSRGVSQWLLVSCSSS
jgi:hypothetical protein